MQNKNQSRKFQVLPLGDYKAELFIPTLIPFSDSNREMKAKRYEHSVTGEKLAVVRVALEAFDGEFASYTSRTNFKNEKKFYAKKIIVAQDDILSDKELAFGNSPFKNQFTALSFFLQDEPRYEGQSPVLGLNNTDQEKYENYELIVAKSQEEFEELKAVGNEIIRTNLELTTNRRPEEIKDNLTTKQVRDSFANKEVADVFLAISGKNIKIEESFNDSKIKKYKIIFFDLDGTLIDTDYANWLSYKEIVSNEIPNMILNFDFEERIDSCFFKCLPKQKLDEIISKKQEVYLQNLNLTKKIQPNVSILEKYSKTKKIILVSNCKKKRGLETLKYHKLDIYFYKMFFAEDKKLSENKYENAIKLLKTLPKDIIAVENDEKEIEKAKQSGIQNVIKMFFPDELKIFTIEPNGFLKQKIKAFYHGNYYGGENWNSDGKIEFALWSLKNGGECNMKHKEYLPTAYKWIKNIILNDLPKIKEKIDLEKLLVCVVPRSKEETTYEEDQLLFRKAVSNIVDKLGDDFINGTNYLIRHTSTKTTHLKYSVKQDGADPYVGITKDTCYISDNLIGKNILLIDDIYTKSVNINEDAIQALLDKGAKSVHFYAVARTVSYK